MASKQVLAEVENRIGLAPGYAYQVLADLARPWQLPVRLVDGEGDYGELRDDHPASHFRHTEARLSPAGEVVLRPSVATLPRFRSGSSTAAPIGTDQAPVPPRTGDRRCAAGHERPGGERRGTR